MSTEIKTLIPDIRKLLEAKEGGWFSPELSNSFASEISSRLTLHFNSTRERPTLRMSQMGPKCPRALWYSIHHPELDEPLPSWAMVKYAFGHIIEGLAIGLAKASGHEVLGEQDEIFVDGIRGHRDCVIDGCIVDVKSAASPSFKKFQDGSIAQDDLFGYLDQLDGYLLGSVDDPLVRNKDTAYLLAIDKQLGHMCLHEHKITADRAENYRRRVELYRSIVELDAPPKCECGVQKDGEAGNQILDVKASYSPQKHSCFPELRTIITSRGPKYYTKIIKYPKYQGVPLVEIDKYGNIVL